MSKNTFANDGCNDSVQDIASVLRQGLDTPKPELFKFDGNPMYYTRFVMNFEASIESKKLLSTASKLLLLIQHCEREVRKLIEYCAMLEPELGYKRAKEVLRDNFGRPNEIARAYIDKLSTGPLIKADDVNGLVKFARDVEECSVTLSHLKYFSDLNNFENIFKIVQRLPFELKRRWLRLAAKVEQAGQEASFADLVTSVKQGAEVMKKSHAKLLDCSKKKSFSSFSVHSKVTEKGGCSKQCPEFCLEAKCCLCSANHKLLDCHIFKDKTVAERKLLTRQYRLCDNCFKRGHIAKRCFLRSACTVGGCKFKHHELLHDSNRGSF